MSDVEVIKNLSQLGTGALVVAGLVTVYLILRLLQPYLPMPKRREAETTLPVDISTVASGKLPESHWAEKFDRLEEILQTAMQIMQATNLTMELQTKTQAECVAIARSLDIVVRDIRGQVLEARREIQETKSIVLTVKTAAAGK